VIPHSKLRGFPPVHGVTRGALRAARPPSELPIVWVGFVAIHALLKSQRLLEVAAAVAQNAIDRRMLSQQRVLGFGVIEAFAYCLDRNLLPSAGLVARLAALGEAPVMRITVAIHAPREENPDISWLVVGPRRVALLTGYLRMQTDEGIARFRVIERVDCDCLPIRKVVTLQTV